MKDLNDFIKRANRFKSDLHQYADDNIILNNPSNNNMVDDINENFDVYQTNMQETTDEVLPDNGDIKTENKEEIC